MTFLNPNLRFLVVSFPLFLLFDPAYSPDLNPIENLGNLFKRKVRVYLKARDESDPSLESMIQSSWREIASDEPTLENLVLSMHSRYDAVIAANGNHTRY